MRDMNPREAEYKAKGVEILAINAFEDPVKGKAWIAESGLDLHWAFADAAALEAFGVTAVPSQVLLDREGKVVWTSNFKSMLGGADAILAEVDAVL